MTTGAATFTAGTPGTVRFDDLPAGDKDVEIWLPHNETTELVALRTDAPVEPAPASDRPVWVHHGSSISHGSNAASPPTTLAGGRGRASAGSTWSTSASAAARCSTRSSPAPCATPPPT